MDPAVVATRRCPIWSARGAIMCSGSCRPRCRWRPGPEGPNWYPPTVRRPVVAVAFLAMAVLAAACSGTQGATHATTSTTRAPEPAGAKPSSLATQICAAEARQDIASSLGEAAMVSTPTWSAADHLYSCDYRYHSGSMTLSMKELSSWSQTYAYFDSLQVQLGKSRDLENLGQGAFQATDGSVVVRKDWKVLLVNSSELPSQFGVPPTSSGDVAVTVADVILGCWAGD